MHLPMAIVCDHLRHKTLARLTNSISVSEVYKRRNLLKAKLHHLENSDAFSPETPVANSPDVPSAALFFDTKDLSHLNRRRKSFNGDPSDRQDLDQDIGNVASAIENDAPLDISQIRSLERLLKWEIDRLSLELKGKCTVTNNQYPRNLNIKDFYGYIPLPTVVYELEYPR